MGFINLSTFRRQEQFLDENQPRRVSDAKAQIEHVERLQEDKDERVKEEYPFLRRTTKDADLPFIPPAEVAERDGDGSNRLWIVVDDIVLDVTKYVERHPGGQQIILGFGGHNCSWQWWMLHSRQIWENIATGLRVGRTRAVRNKHKRPEQKRPASSRFGFNDWD